MRKVLFLLFFGICTIASSQTYFYLEEVELKKKEDFIENQKNATMAIDYLMSTPIDKKDHDRKACIRFIIRYAEKTPFTTITIGTAVSKLSKKNIEMIVFYMGLWLKSTFNNKSATNDEHERYTFTEIYKYAKKGNNVTPNEAVRSLIKAGDESKLDEWIKKINE